MLVFIFLGFIIFTCFFHFNTLLPMYFSFWTFWTCWTFNLKEDFISMWQRTWCSREGLYHLHYYINGFFKPIRIFAVDINYLISTNYMYCCSHFVPMILWFLGEWMASGNESRARKENMKWAFQTLAIDRDWKNTFVMFLEASPNLGELLYAINHLWWICVILLFWRCALQNII